jgi:hypothetical protein
MPDSKRSQVLESAYTRRHMTLAVVAYIVEFLSTLFMGVDRVSRVQDKGQELVRRSHVTPPASTYYGDLQHATRAVPGHSHIIRV